MYKKRKNFELIKAFGLLANKDCSFASFDTKICKNEKHAESLNKILKIPIRHDKITPHKISITDSIFFIFIKFPFTHHNATVCYNSILRLISYLFCKYSAVRANFYQEFFELPTEFPSYLSGK